MDKELEDVMKKLKECGVNLGEWSDVEAGQKEHAMLKPQITLLKKMSELLKEQVKKDQELIIELHEKVDRMKHGGGQ